MEKVFPYNEIQTRHNISYNFEEANSVCSHTQNNTKNGMEKRI